MPKYQMPDGKDYDFDNDNEASQAMSAWESQYGSEPTDSLPKQIGRSIAGGVGAAADFIAPANLAVAGLVEGSRALMPEALGGVSSEQAAQNITTGNIPGTSIPYSELAPSKLVENFTGAGSIQNKEYEQANKPMHALSQAATDLGAWSSDKANSPLLGTVTNLAAATMALGGAHKVATNATKMMQSSGPSSKLDVAKAESDARRGQEETIANSFAARKAGFTFNPNTNRMERGSEYIDPMTNQIVDSRKGTQGSVEPRVDERFQEPAKELTTADEFYNLLKEEEQKQLGTEVDTSGTRNPYMQGDTKANVEVDSVSGRPVFPEETKVDNTLTRPDGTMRYGLHEKGNDFVTINPDSIARLWLKLSPEKKIEMGLRSAEDLQNFVELHERKHTQDRTNLGDETVEKLGREELEKRANNAARDSLAHLKADESVGAARLPEGFREPYDGAPRQLPEQTRTPAQMRANKEHLEKQLESVNTKLEEARQGKEHDVGALQRKQAVLESLIEKHAESIEAGRKMGFSFEAKKSSGSSAKSKASTSFTDIPERLSSVFKDEAEQLYQGARNAGKSHAQAVEELRQIYGSDEVGMGIGAPFTKEHLDMLKSLFEKGAPSIKAFAAHIERSVDDPVTKELYEKYYGKVVKELTPEEAAVAKVPGLKETISPELQPLETMMERWKTEQDISQDSRAARENLSSGGRMTAARTGNSFIDWNVENILTTTRRAQVVIKELQNDLKGEANKITGSLLSQFKDKGEGNKVFAEAMGALLKSEGKNEMPNISPQAKILIDKIRKTLDDLGLKIQDELRVQGVEGFQWRPNYLAGVFFGPYRSLVKDAAGNTIGVIAGRTKAEAIAAVDHVKKNMPDVTLDVVEFNAKFDSGQGSLSARYGKASEVLELLRNQGEAAQALQKHLGDYYAEAQENYMGYKQHFKHKEGVFGAEGSRPWETALANAKDLFEAQLGIIDHGYHWLAEQKIAKDMNQILTNSDIALPESKRYVNQYLDHAFGRTNDFVQAMDAAFAYSADKLGIAPSALKEMSALARNMALTGTLGVSGGFIVTQGVQVLQCLAVAASKAIGEGIYGNRAGSSLLGGMDLIHGLTGRFENMTVEGKYFFDYFVKNGIMDPHLVEHTIHRKIVNTTGMSPLKKAMWEATNAVFKVGEVSSGIIGKLTIEKPEAWTRGSFAMTLAHYYKSAGMSLKEAAIKADKDTSVLFVDYSAQERAMMFARMGELGKFASTVSTFKLNNLNQWFTFGNKKMYGTLAALALTSWFTTGMFGMPGGDEAEFGATWLKSKGVDIPTPREYMLAKVPSWVSFGPLSKTPTLFGGTDTALHRKFAQDDVIPNDLASFIYPLSSFYTNKIEKGWDFAKSGFAKQEGAVLTRELVPGNLKYAVDYVGLTNDKGLTIDPNQIHEKNPAHYDRTKNEWKLAAILGITSQREFVDKQTNQLDKMSEMAWKESTKRKVSLTMSAFDDGNSEKFKKLFAEATKYNPTAAKDITEYIQGHATAANMSLEQMLQIKFAKGATSSHGVNRFKQFQSMQENK